MDDGEEPADAARREVARRPDRSSSAGPQAVDPGTVTASITSS
ncbi:hypothetical protein [Lentzea atacamensis]|nr:hypothetical protein [Lentzea atacamensis]